MRSERWSAGPPNWRPWLLRSLNAGALQGPGMYGMGSAGAEGLPGGCPGCCKAWLQAPFWIQLNACVDEGAHGMVIKLLAFAETKCVKKKVPLRDGWKTRCLLREKQSAFAETKRLCVMAGQQSACAKTKLFHDGWETKCLCVDWMDLGWRHSNMQTDCGWRVAGGKEEAHVWNVTVKPMIDGPSNNLKLEPHCGGTINLLEHRTPPGIDQGCAKLGSAVKVLRGLGRE
eukprot:1160968-Pelagomonas_calceolata.AAC.4